MRTGRKTPAPDPRTERMFSYLDDKLSAVERDAYEAELAADPERASEVEGQRALLDTLDEMAAYAPSNDFRVRVLASLNAPESWWERLWRRVGGAPRPLPNVFAAFLDEGLTARQARALTEFVARDAEAADALKGWKRLFGALESLPGFQPAEGFADGVMARLGAIEEQRAEQLKVAPARRRRWPVIGVLPAAVRGWELAAAWIDARWPTPRDRFAATSGMAVGPVAAFLVTLHMLSGNPLLTTANVANFVRTRVGGAVSRLGDIVSGHPLANSAMGRVSGLMDTWTLTSTALVTGLIVCGALTLLSAWILYRNVVKVPQSDSRHVSF